MFWVIVIIVIVFGVVAGVLQANSNKKHEDERREVMINALANVPDFKPSIKLVGVNSLYTVAFDDEQQKMLYLIGQIGQSPAVFN